ncbi:MAG: hypothetical protein AB1505_02215 [Candidatus Latescibacterota bacterium]
MSERKFVLLIADLDRELKQHRALVEEGRAALMHAGETPAGLAVRGMGSMLHEACNP